MFWSTEAQRLQVPEAPPPASSKAFSGGWSRCSSAERSTTANGQHGAEAPLPPSPASAKRAWLAQEALEHMASDLGQQAGAEGHAEGEQDFLPAVMQRYLGTVFFTAHSETVIGTAAANRCGWRWHGYAWGSCALYYRSGGGLRTVGRGRP